MLDTENAGYVNRQSKEEYIAFFNAIERGDINYLSRCLPGQTLNEKGRMYTCPLSHAIIANQMEVARLFLQHGADPNQIDLQEYPPLWHAINREREHPGWVQFMLDHGANPKVCGRHNSSMLQTAVSQNNKMLVNKFLDLGIDINYRDNYGCCALTDTCETPSPDMMRHLLERGANPWLEDDHGTTPILRAELYFPELLLPILAEFGHVPIINSI